MSNFGGASKLVEVASMFFVFRRPGSLTFSFEARNNWTGREGINSVKSCCFISTAGIEKESISAAGIEKEAVRAAKSFSIPAKAFGQLTDVAAKFRRVQRSRKSLISAVSWV